MIRSTKTFLLILMLLASPGTIALSGQEPL